MHASANVHYVFKFTVQPAGFAISNLIHLWSFDSGVHCKLLTDVVVVLAWRTPEDPVLLNLKFFITLHFCFETVAEISTGWDQLRSKINIPLNWVELAEFELKGHSDAACQFSLTGQFDWFQVWKGYSFHKNQNKVKESRNYRVICLLTT